MVGRMLGYVQHFPATPFLLDTRLNGLDNCAVLTPENLVDAFLNELFKTSNDARWHLTRDEIQSGSVQNEGHICYLASYLYAVRNLQRFR